MPGVRGPLCRIAGLTGMNPFDDRRLPGSSVFAVIPGIGAARALESVDYSVPIRDDLIIVHFEIANLASRFDPDLGVVEKIRGVWVLRVRHGVDFAAPIDIAGFK